MPDLTASILHRVYLLLYYIGALYVKASSRLPRGARVQGSVAAFPYYPEGLPGGEERIAMWKAFFEKDGIRFDVFWAADKSDFEKGFHSGNTFRKYRFYFSVLLKRMVQFTKAGRYETVWIQRAAVPFYDVRSAFFERCIKSKGQRLVFDYYDADYLQTPVQTWGCIAAADAVTVANPGLRNAISERTDCPVHLFRLCLPQNVYPTAPPPDSEKIKIGWIGSRANAAYLRDILTPLVKIREKYGERVEFNFVCRTKIDLPGLDVKWTAFDEPGFDYHRWFGSIHIGLAVYPLRNQNAAFKTSMKSLEYWASKTATVSGPYGISDRARNKVNALISRTDEQWVQHLGHLVTAPENRRALADEGFACFLRYHSFEKVYPEIRHALLNEGNPLRKPPSSAESYKGSP